MSNKTDRDDRTVDALIDALMGFIDEASPAEVERFAGAGADPKEVIAGARGAISAASKRVAAERRQQTAEAMAFAARVPPIDVSSMCVDQLEAIFAAHVANDDASATMAARHKKGEMDEAELRSVVADILRLRDGSD